MSHDNLGSGRPQKRRRVSAATSIDTADGDNMQHPDTDTEGTSSGDDSHDFENEEEEEEEEEHEQMTGSNGDHMTNNDHRESGHVRQREKSKAKPSVSRSTADGPTPGAGTFTMQVDEMLRQLRPDFENIQKTAEETLRKLKIVIETIPDTAPQALREAEKELLKSHKVVVPFPHPRPTPEVKYKFAFSKPTSVNVVGSFALRTYYGERCHPTVDLVVQMPNTLFEAKDYLNYRYFHKRAYYLAWLAAGIKASGELDVEIDYNLLNGNSLIPVLLAKPFRKGKAATTRNDFLVQIIPVNRDDAFPIDKTLPDRNCVRPDRTNGAEMPDPQPTPFYNGSLRSLCTMNGYLKLLHGATVRCLGFRDACVLGSIWLRQRGLTSSVAGGGFGHFEWAALMALLLTTGGPQGRPVLSESYSSYQLFGGTLRFLTLRDLIRDPVLTVASKSVGVVDMPLFFDSLRGLNLLYKMSQASYDLLKMEAQAASGMFGSNRESRLDSLFIIRVSQPLLRFDVVAQVSMPLPSTSAHEQTAASQRVYDIMHRGLGDRKSFLSVWEAPSASWPVNKARTDQITTAFIGIVLDSVNAARSVDRGPAAEDAVGTASYREFWGEKAELRRFKDGQIRESLVWSSKDPIDVTKEIVSFLMQSHCEGRPGASFKIFGNDFARFLEDRRLLMATASYQRVSVAYGVLETTLRKLEGLPLQIRQLQPAGTRLRNAHIESAQLRPATPTDVTLQFEGSARWPDDLAAVQMTKLAFLLKVAEQLEQSQVVETTRVGIENSATDALNQSFLDVFIASESFRLRIHHEREQFLIEQRLSEKQMSAAVRQDAVFALAEYKRLFLRAPLHTQAMQKLSTQFPAYPATVRVLKTWLNSHMLGNHFRPEAVEILALKVFCDPHPWNEPSTAVTGFLRTISFLARWNWQATPLIIGTSGSMKNAELSTIRTKFSAWRHLDPNMNRVAMFAATNYDVDGITWTEHSPNKIVAVRMSALAKAADQLVKDKQLDLDIESLFKHNDKDYDFVIRLKRQGRKGTLKAKTSFKNLKSDLEHDSSLAGLDPVVMYLEELQRVYGDAVLFLADTIAQDRIAGLWSPHTAYRRWKINLGWSSRPLPNEDDAPGETADVNVTINKEAMLAEMARLGGDLVEEIDVR